jgi:SAM-dependent methyltransferase
MITLFSSNYLARSPVEKAMKDFGRKFSSDQKVLDIGCGTKPYQHFFQCEYIGVDPLEKAHPDILAPAWDIPVANDSFDGVILNQSLEHIRYTEETIAEIKRILKPGGFAIVTVPHTMKNHSEPIPANLSPFSGRKDIIRCIDYWQEDYYRFTKYALLSLFADFKIISLKETSGYAGTLVQLVNYFFASFTPIRQLFIPIYFVNNCFGKFIDTFFYTLTKLQVPGFRKINSLIYSSLPLNYVLLIKK